MKNIYLYEAHIAKECKSLMYKGDVKTNWQFVGLFENEEDARYAITIYGLVYKNVIGDNILNDYILERKSFSQDLGRGRNRVYFKSLREFVNNDLNIVHYLKDNRLTLNRLVSLIDASRVSAVYSM